MTNHRREPSRFPVRGAIGLGVTAAGLAMLLSLKPPGTTDGQFAVLVSDPPTGGGGSDGTVGLVLANPPATAGSISAAPSATTSASASQAGTAAATAGASPSVTPSTSPGAEAIATTAAAITLVGDPVSFRFGTVQVQVTVEDGVITDVQALQLPDEDRHSLRISQEVEPILAEETLAAQSASIDTVSGATYTSRAYAQSLQSALDELAA